MAMQYSDTWPNTHQVMKQRKQAEML